MTFTWHEDYFKWRAASLMAGRYEDMAGHHRLPLQVDLQGTPWQIAERDELILQLHRLRLALNDRGVQALEPRIVALGLPGARQRVWVDWQGLDAAGIAMARGKSVYDIDWSMGRSQVTAMAHGPLLVPEFLRPSFRRRLPRPGG